MKKDYASSRIPWRGINRLQKMLLSMTFLLTAFAASAQFPNPYCAVSFSDAIEPITLVNFAGINNVTSNVIDASAEHEDFTAIFANVEAGATYPISIQGNTDGGFTSKIVAFFDWNQDGDFLDAGETYNLPDIVGSTGLDAIVSAANIQIPAGALAGTTRMRIIKRFSTVPDACNDSGFGQSEDYSVTVTIPTCPSVSGLTATTTEATADLSWVENGTATNWDIEYGPAGFAPTGTATVSVTATNTTISGLNASTSYQYYVRAYCSISDQSTWTGPFNFTTTQIPAAIPFTDNFSTAQWSFVNGTQANKWYIGAAAGNPANGMYISNDNGVTNAYTINSSSVTQAYRDITFPAGTNPFGLKFDWKANGESSSDYLRVWLVPSGSTITAGTQITTTNVPGAFQIGTNFNQTLNWTISQEYVIPATYAGTSARLVFEWRNDGSLGTPTPAAVDNVGMTVLTCPAPTALIASSITANTASLGWSEAGTSTSWDIEYGIAPYTSTGTPTLSGTTNPVTISGLTSSTVYQFYVRSNCGGSDLSTWSGPFSFTTTQVPAIVPFTDDFSANEWSFVNGTQTNKWVVGNAAGNPANGMYISNDNGVTNTYTLNPASVTHAYRDISFPAGLNPFSLKFDWKANGESTYDYLRVWLVPSSATITAGTQISTGNTPGAIQIGGNFNQSTVWASTQSYLISETYAGTNARLVFEWKNDGGGGTQAPAAVDNIAVTIISCPDPTALTATNVAANTANLGWTQAGTSTNWDIEYGVAPHTFTGTPTVSVTNNPATITGLTPSTSYVYYVRSNCGGSDQSAWVGPFSFTTTQVPAVVPFVDDFSTNEWALVNGTQTNKWFVGSAAGNPADGLYISNDAGVTNAYGNTVSTTQAYRDVQFPAGTNTFNLKFDWKANGEGTVDRFRVWLVPSTSTITAGTQITTGNTPGALQIGADFNLSTVWATSQDFVIPASYAGTISRLVFEWRNNATTANQAPAAIDNVEISIVSCSAPTALTATNVTDNAADLSWTENGTASAWEIEYGVQGFTPTGNPTLPVAAYPITITSLNPNTTYSYYVRSACSVSLQSSWSGPFSFTTTQIPAVVPFTDDFSANEWSFVNGTQVNQWFIGSAAGNPANGMYISNDAGVTNAYTITTGSTTHAYRDVQFPATTNDFNLTFDWKAFGQGAADRIRVWMVPTSATITAGTQIATGTPAGAVQLGGNLNQSAVWFTGQNIVIPASYAGTTARLVFEWRNDASGGTQTPAAIDNVKITEITCVSPTALVASNVTTSSVDLTWTENGTATDWEISYGTGTFNPNSGTIVSVTTNPATVTGLLPSTAYKFYVRSNCSASDSSNWFGPISVTTLCAPITALPWTEQFDNLPAIGTGIFPGCWFDENPGKWSTADNAVSGFDADALSGPNFLRISYSSDATIWTPEFSLVAGQAYEFKFNWAGDEGSDWEGSVLVNNSQSSTGATMLGTKFVEFGDVTTLAYQEETYCFTPTTSGVYSFGIKGQETGSEWYLSFDDFSLKQINSTPGTDGALSVCETSNAVDLNTVISNAPVGGNWSFNLNPNAVNNAGILNATSVPSGTHQFMYVTGGCAPDTTVATITIVRTASAGNDGSLAVCRNQPFNLLSGLAGNATLGGVWTDPNAVVVPNGNAIASNIPGQYNFKYIVTNGICAGDTAKVVVNVTGCNYLGLEDVAFEGFNLYPNPTSKVVYISNLGSTEVFNYEVLDMNGRVIMSADQAINGSTTTEIDMSNVEIGVYLVRVFNENADKTFRVVKN